MDDCKYAFLIETYWFQLNLWNFREVKDMDSVPVLLYLILNVQDYGERFRGKTDQSGNQSTPFCNSYDDRNTMICACQPGMEGNPYLLQPCQGTQTESLLSGKKLR
ncbi:unnamed protein product [Prunus armeniaca]|uniref:Uncharacterized protein n=1 Tax=Prunus armeniaca TaxID=36596 RepID=A0A6J5XBG1_PRUAR|nr:unnamed protein product [Prunus armeniaca]